MRNFVLVLVCISPLLLFSFEDTLHKRKINVSVGVELLIPQTRGYTFFSDKPYPNSIQASPVHPVYGSTVYKNACSAFANFEARVLFPKLYFQTGLHCSKYTEVDYIFRDSLSTVNGQWGNTFKWVTESYNISVPLGFSYRFNEKFFLSAGFMPCLRNIYIQSETIYNGNSQLTPTYKTVLIEDGYLVRYFSMNIKVMRRVYLNVGLMDLSWKKSDVYYSLGARFYIL